MARPFKYRLVGVWRLFALAAVLAWYAAKLLLFPSQRRSLAARAHWLQDTCRSCLRAMGVAWTPVGLPPASGAVIGANHLSYLDILVLSSMKPLVFVAKSQVRGWPVFGWFARMAGTRFVDRDRRGDVARVGAELAPVIEAGLSVVVFLEGTSTGGETVLPFKSSLLEPAIQARWPVVPAAVGYTVPDGYSASDDVCYWGDMTLVPHLVNLATVPRIEARVAWGKPVLPEGDRKLAAAMMHREVLALHGALRERPTVAPASLEA